MQRTHEPARAVTRARGLAVALIAATLATAPCPAGAVTERWDHATHLWRARWLLWTDGGRAAVLNTETGALQALDTDRLQPVLRMAPAMGREDQGWLYALSRPDEGEVVLARVRLDGSGFEEVRIYDLQYGDRPAFWLERGPAGTVLVAAAGDDGWTVDVIDGTSGTVTLQVGPLPRQPRDLVAWSQGRWLVLDDAALWSWPDGAVWRYSADGAPARWTDPPPMVRGHWPTSLLLLDGDHLLLGSTQEVSEIDGPYDGTVLRAGRGLRWPADGPARTAAIEQPGPPQRVDDRVYLWERGGQRLLRLIHDRPDNAWTLQTTWSAPTGSADAGAGPAQGDGATGDAEAAADPLRATLERTPGQYWLADFKAHLDDPGALGAGPEDSAYLRAYLDGGWRWYGARVLAASLLERLGEPYTPPREPPPRTVDEVLAGWAGMPFVDVDGTPAAEFWNRERHALYVLAVHRDEAIPALLAQGGPHAAHALALLRAEDADAWLRTLVLDPTPYGWEGGGCTYPTSSVGVVALEQLWGAPLSALLKLKPGDRKRYLDAAKRTRAQTPVGQPLACDEGGFAIHLLEALERE